MPGYCLEKLLSTPFFGVTIHQWGDPFKHKPSKHEGATRGLDIGIIILAAPFGETLLNTADLAGSNSRRCTSICICQEGESHKVDLHQAACALPYRSCEATGRALWKLPASPRMNSQRFCLSLGLKAAISLQLSATNAQCSA